jgi:hypothetical protein
MEEALAEISANEAMDPILKAVRDAREAEVARYSVYFLALLVQKYKY